MGLFNGKLKGALQDVGQAVGNYYRFTVDNLAGAVGQTDFITSDDYKGDNGEKWDNASSKVGRRVVQAGVVALTAGAGAAALGAGSGLAGAGGGIATGLANLKNKGVDIVDSLPDDLKKMAKEGLGGVTGLISDGQINGSSITALTSNDDGSAVNSIAAQTDWEKVLKDFAIETAKDTVSKVGATVYDNLSDEQQKALNKAAGETAFSTFIEWLQMEWWRIPFIVVAPITLFIWLIVKAFKN